jgi:hypothetical protein
LFGLGVLAAWVVGIVGAILARRRVVPAADPDADEIDLLAVFAPLGFRSTARDFQGGAIELWYGGGVIDLRSATLAAEGAVLKVRAMFGGAQIVIPASWQLSTRVIGLGGVGDGRPRMERSPDAPHLTIEGFAMFGGFGITSELTEEAERQLDKMAAAAPA